jgi:hypothetical protein
LHAIEEILLAKTFVKILKLTLSMQMGRWILLTFYPFGSKVMIPN